MTAPTRVTDPRSHSRDQIANAAEAIGKSKHKRKVFEEVYRGKQKYKTVSELIKATGLEHKRVLDAGKKLADQGYIHQTKVDGETAYEKDSFFKHHKRRILSLAGSSKKLSIFATKTNPTVAVKISRTTVPRKLAKVKQVTVDDLDQFANVKKVRRASVAALPMAEARFKKGIQRVIGEPGKFQDWGGEQNDLHTTRVRFNGKRVDTAFAFKGKGKKGLLTPNMMGKRGDQIPRLFNSSAKLYVLQYWDQVGEGIYDAMKAYATIRSIADGDTIYYAVIDGIDSARIVKAYPKAFK